MFRRSEATDCIILWGGAEIPARAGEPLAAALLAAGITRFRATLPSAAPRGPYCMMGACFDCVVTVDGEAGRQACMVAVTPGMSATP